jgi:hypothetical protein
MVVWGQRGALQGIDAMCTQAELEEGRSLFTNAKQSAYAASAVSLDTPNETGEPRSKILIDSGKGDSPWSWLFEKNVADPEVVEMLAFFEHLYAEYLPDSAVP